MNRLRGALLYLAIAGNGLYFLWILYNGIDEGFKARPVEAVAMFGLLGLLLLNVVVLFTARPRTPSDRAEP